MSPCRACLWRSSILVLLLSACATRLAQERIVPADNQGRSGVLHLRCTTTDPYCGGAEPDPDDLPRPHPWTGTLYLRPVIPDSTGTSAINDVREPVTDTVRMNTAGEGYVRLPAGHYVLIDRDHLDTRRYEQLLRDFTVPARDNDPIDTACLRQWLRGPFPVLTIHGGDTLHITHPQYGRCPWYATPCVGYHGPLPP